MEKVIQYLHKDFTDPKVGWQKIHTETHTHTHSFTHTVLLFSIQTITDLRLLNLGSKNPHTALSLPQMPLPKMDVETPWASPPPLPFSFLAHLAVGPTETLSYIPSLFSCQSLLQHTRRNPQQCTPPSRLYHQPLRVPEPQCQRGWCLKSRAAQALRTKDSNLGKLFIFFQLYFK